MSAQSDDLLRPEDLAEKFQVDRRVVIDWTNRYDWPCIRIGRTIRYSGEQFAQILAMQTVAPERTSSTPRIAGQTVRSRRAS